MTEPKKKESRNKIYERKQKAKCLNKVTMWIPDHAEAEFVEMANYIKEQWLLPLADRKELIPYMMRNTVTGHNAGRVPQHTVSKK